LEKNEKTIFGLKTQHKICRQNEYVYFPFRAQCGNYHFITQRAAALALGWAIFGFQPKMEYAKILTGRMLVENQQIIQPNGNTLGKNEKTIFGLKTQHKNLTLQ
jgi:coproporphyrinogen III oxidase